MPTWIAIILVSAAAIIQAGAAPLPIVLGLSLVLASEAQLSKTLAAVATGAVMLEVLSAAPPGTIALPLISAVITAQVIGSKWLSATGSWRTPAILVLGSVIAAALEAFLQRWDLRQSLTLVIQTSVIALVWLGALRLFLPKPYGFPAAPVTF
ncbi:hypothetical protein HYW67_04040 [Candidatus Parcubacteria bacterium]|nr:hypothetical protein [Candidatus Parcubacteria bacterium]